MMARAFFKIPDDRKVMVKLVEAMPADWLWVNGELHASNDAIVSGRVEANTGFQLGRFRSTYMTIVGSVDKDTAQEREPNLLAILVERKMPGFIRFSKAGYDSGIITLKLAKRLIVGFLKKGYRGWLHFFRGNHAYENYCNPARCEMVFVPWRKPLVIFCPEEAGAQPARVKFEWDSSHDGSEKDVESIIAVCRGLEFEEYQPTAAQAPI